jgi:hypothetical protein
MERNCLCALSDRYFLRFVQMKAAVPRDENLCIIRASDG